MARSQAIPIFERVRRWVATRLVDRQYYLQRNADVAAAGVDPVEHFAQHWRAAPLRAPNARAETWYYAASPLLVLILRLLRRDRQDVTDCFRYRINQLSTRSGPAVQLGAAHAIARFLAARPRASRGDRTAADGLGAIFPVFRLGQDGAGWVARQVIEPAGLFTFEDPAVALSDAPRTVRTVHRPELALARIDDATVFGFSQIVAHAAFVVYEPEADPQYRYTSRQCEFVINCYRSPADRVIARVPDRAEASIEEAILLVGRCSANYFHFLIEYMTKGYVIERAGLPSEIPLIVTDDLFPQELEAIRLVFPDRPVIPRRHASRLDVRRLHVPSVMTFIPDTPTVAFWEVAAVNDASLSWLRDRVMTRLGRPTAATARRIYLGRSAGRNITNAADVEAVFARHGFDIVNPGQLSFSEQVALFAGARCIAGPIGSAFSNLVFASPGALVLGLVSPFAVDFSIFASLAAFAECRYVAVPGRRDDFEAEAARPRPSLEITHGNYAIDIDEMERILRAMLPD